MARITSNFSILALATACCGIAKVHADDWTEHCYPSFSEDVAALTGSGAQDCGFFDLQSSEEDKERVLACARRAAQQKGAFKFGYLGFGVDSAFCAVAIRDNHGKYRELFLDFDVSGGGGAEPSPALWISRCHDLRFGNGQDERFFQFRRCRERPKITRALIEGDIPAKPR